MICSLRKQPTCGDATTGFPAKWNLRNEGRKFIVMTRQYQDLGSAPYWLNQISHAARPIRSTTQIWVVTHHQYGISAHVTLTHLAGKAGVVASPNFGCFLIGWKYLFLTQQCYNSFHFILTDLLSFASCIRTSFVLGAVLKRVFDSMGDCTHRLKSF